MKSLIVIIMLMFPVFCFATDRYMITVMTAIDEQSDDTSDGLHVLEITKDAYDLAYIGYYFYNKQPDGSLYTDSADSSCYIMITDKFIIDSGYSSIFIDKIIKKNIVDKTLTPKLRTVESYYPKYLTE